MPTGAKAPRLTIDDALEVLDQLGASRLERLILVGGQAAAFWIAKYEIADPRRVTTKDIDVFLSEQRPGVAVECAKDLSGELLRGKINLGLRPGGGFRGGYPLFACGP